MKKYIASFFIIFIIMSITFCEQKFTPVGKLSLLGGQYFFENESTTFGGNINIFLSPVVNFSSEQALMPILFLTYRGTKDVRELVGGGTLTQECINLGPIGVKYVYKISPVFKLKLKTTYKIEYLKETKDEQWQKGLFDYHKVTISGEVENKLSENSLLRVGLDYFIIKYPNYKSLVSKPEYKTSIDTTTYTEISENAGKDVLDYNSIDCFVEAIHTLSENTVFCAMYNVGIKNFNDQHIVNKLGKFEKNLRRDVLQILSLSIVLNFERIILKLADSIKYYDSNQNSYDVSFTRFTENSYDYVENILSPSLGVNFGSKPYVSLYLWWDIGYKNYLSRLAQNEVGKYTDEKLWQQINVLGISFKYPLEKFFRGLSFKISANYNVVSSNMKYEKFYRYNYSCYNYFAGVEVEF